MKRTKEVNGRVYEFYENQLRVFSMTHMGLIFLWAVTIPSQKDADNLYADLNQQAMLTH